MGLSLDFDVKLYCTTGGGRFVTFGALKEKFKFDTQVHSIPLALKLLKQSKYKHFQIDPTGV